MRGPQERIDRIVMRDGRDAAQQVFERADQQALVP